MKKIFLLCIFSVFAFSFALNAQQWTEKLPEKSDKAFTFYDYQKAFNDYWEPFNVKGGYYFENNEKIKATGWKQFKRWEYFWEKRINKSTGEFPVVDLTEIYQEYVIDKQSGRSESGDWVSLGPNQSPGGYAGIGRINCVQFHPTDANTFWIGAPAGGIWVTGNGGLSWEILNNNTEVIGVSDIVIPSDYDDSGIIYIATGDRDHWDNRSVGVLKSTDQGITWESTGLSFTVSQGENTYRLLLDPNDDEIILAATTDGVYKTTNGGTNWTNMSSLEFIDMEYKPGDFTTLYGSTTNGKIYLSVNGGTSWTQVHNAGERIELAVSVDEPNWVYALVANSSSGLYGVFKSTNSGSSFIMVYDGGLSGHNLLGWNSNGTGSGGQGWYDLSLAADPNDANNVYLGGVNTWRTTNGGTSWNIVNHWWGDGVQAVHADKHNLKFNENTGVLFEVNDGGIYKTTNGTSWTHLTNGMVISQIYRLGVSQTDAETTIIGLQDNGTKAIISGNWEDVIGGDGMECLIDYTDANVQYGSLYFGDIYRTTNSWGSDYNISNNIPGGANGAWVTPYIIDPANNQTLYIGYEDLWKTTNRGNSFAKIGDFSDGNLQSLAICQSSPNVIVAATYSKLQKTLNGGLSWTTITSNLPTGSYSVTYITIKDTDPEIMWATLSSYNGNSVYKTINGGTSWTNISGSLPSIPANSIVQNQLNITEEELYVGTDAGVYLKIGESDWVPFSTGFPNVVVDELDIYYNTENPSDSRLRAATFGRGLWETDLYSATDILIASIVAMPGCDTGTITISSNMSGEQTFYLTDIAGVELDSAAVDAMFYDFEGIEEGIYKGKIKKNDVYSELTEQVELINNTIPAQAGDIGGETLVCLGVEGVVYQVDEVDGTDNYIWEVPTGVEIITGQGTNLIEVNFTVDAVSGGITVQTENECGLGEVSNALLVEVSTVPVATGDISGPTMITAGDEVFDYMIDEVEGAESYFWILDPTWSLISGQGTNQIQILFESDAADGILLVNAQNNCGDGENSSLDIDVVHVGLNEIGQSEIRMYPNPTSGILNVELGKDLKEGANIQIINLIGEIVYLLKVTEQKVQVDLSGFSPGIYLVRVQSGEQLLTKRIILDR